ncbi:MAG: EamA family transporter [Treponema sp.]|nr:EamA family transporter [Candidatus Treponema equifaecale]
MVLVYGIIKGLREICKKKSLEKNSVTEVLLVYTFLSLIICSPQIPNAMGLSLNQYLWIALKAFVIFIAWIAGFKAIKKLPISLCGVLDLSRVLFASFLGVLILGESITIYKGIGLVFVSGGLLFLKFNPFYKKNSEIKRGDGSAVIVDQQKKNSNSFFIFLAFLSSILNAVSGLLDKILMKEMNSSQLQFWYTFFLVAYYAIYALARRIKINRSVWKNIWVWLLAVGIIAMDKALFIANGFEESQVTIMTMIKQSSVIVSILSGKFMFKEKHILHKSICALIIVAGILIGIMG